MLKVFLNVLWVILVGWELALLYAAAGFIMFITVIGIPFGIQAFKLAAFVIWPFGRVAVPIEGDNPALSTIGNVVWVVVVGWWLFLAHMVAALVLCVTIIGIPFGIQAFKMGKLAVWPFGRTIVFASEVEGGTPSVFYLD